MACSKLAWSKVAWLLVVSVVVAGVGCSQDEARGDAGALVDAWALDASALADAASHDGDAGMGDAGAGDAGEVPVVIDDRDVPAEAALYTLDGTRWDVHGIGAALDAVASDAESVALLVHGRACGGGGEPAKSLGEAMPEIASAYDAVPILLYWPGASDACPLGFPEERARAAGVALAVVAADLQRYELEHPRFDARVTLVTHSMGSLVLESATEVPGVEALPEHVFDAVVVSAGASAAEGHDAWLARVTFGRARYVAVNQSDLVLRAAEVGRSARLGRGVDDVALAARAVYADFSANDVNHAYYLPSGQSGAGMEAFYRAVMRGMPFDVDGAIGVASRTTRDGARVVVFDGT